ncbi:hypothetical protein CC79DRAFT_461950 [Sarocladium strictum]
MKAYLTWATMNSTNQASPGARGLNPPPVAVPLCVLAQFTVLQAPSGNEEALARPLPKGLRLADLVALCFPAVAPPSSGSIR